MYQLLSPLPCAAATANRLPSGDQSYSYTYMSAGEICFASPPPASTTASRCSKNTSLISPVSGVSATSGPAARVAFSVKRNAMDVPSGDHPGDERNPFNCVNFRAGPPAALLTYSCGWPFFTTSERNAIFWLSGDHATLP